MLRPGLIARLGVTIVTLPSWSTLFARSDDATYCPPQVPASNPKRSPGRACLPYTSSQVSGSGPGPGPMATATTENDPPGSINVAWPSTAGRVDRAAGACATAGRRAAPRAAQIADRAVPLGEEQGQVCRHSQAGQQDSQRDGGDPAMAPGLGHRTPGRHGGPDDTMSGCSSMSQSFPPARVSQLSCIPAVCTGPCGA